MMGITFRSYMGIQPLALNNIADPIGLLGASKDLSSEKFLR